MDKREVIKHLHQFGTDFQNEHQYVKAEKFFKQATDLAESINDRSLIIREKYWLAVAQVMQGKYQPALSEYTELIQVAYSPSNQTLTETDYLYLARSFFQFVSTAKSLPDMKIADLERVLDRGLDWLLSIGKREWTAGFYLERGSLRQAQGQHEEALEEFEAALAIARRESDKKFASGYTLAHYIYRLSNHLQVYLNRLEEAERYYWELVDGYKFDNLYKQRAWSGLAYIALAKRDFSRAEAAAQRALDLAQEIESPEPLCSAHDLLGEIYWTQNQIQRVIEAKIQAWRYARRWGNQKQLYRIYVHLFEIRHHQTWQNPQRYIPKALRWLRWTLPLAERLDHQEGSTKRQQFIQQQQVTGEQVLAQWSQVNELTTQGWSYAHLADLYETYLLYAEIHIESAYLGNPQEHILKVLQYCGLALPLAKQLDTQENSTIRQQEIRQIQVECEKFSQ